MKEGILNDTGMLKIKVESKICHAKRLIKKNSDVSVNMKQNNLYFMVTNKPGKYTN